MEPSCCELVVTTVLVVGVVVVTVVGGCWDKAHAQRQTMTKTATMETTKKIRVPGTDTPTAIAKVLRDIKCYIFSSV